MDKFEHDNYYIVKIIVVGESGVGKSSLTDYFVNNKPVTNFGHQTSTIGVEFFVKVYNVNDKKFRLQIWDTGGQEKFRAITRSYYRGAEAAVVCFSIINRNSYNQLIEFINDIHKFAKDDIRTIMVGTFADKEDLRTVSYSEAKEFAQKYGMEYIEISSKTGNNIDECFYKLLKTISNQIDKNNLFLKTYNKPNLNLNVNVNTDNDSSCCK